MAASTGATPVSHEWVDSLVDFGRGLWRTVNPVTAINAMGQAIAHPVETGAAIGEAQGREAQKAQTAFEDGDYITGARHLLAYVIPLLGPGLSAAADRMQGGDIAEGAGEAIGIGLSVAGPRATANARVKVPPIARVNPTQAAAAQFAESRGIPLDAATATGRPVVQAVQRRAADSIGGAGAADKLRSSQATHLTRVADELAATAHPTAVTTEQAGQGIRDAVVRRVADYTAAADAAYAKVRQAEATATTQIADVGGVKAPHTSTKAFTVEPLAVDVAPTKAAVRPIYDALKREAELVPLMGDKARALTMLDRLMTSPDLAPLSVADAALGELKSLARVDQSFRRTAGQGATAKVVADLEKAVRTAARTAGRDVYDALMDGRAATVNKYKAIDLLDRLRTEPVQTFRQATYARDAGVAQLREIATFAPDELAKVGRAYLDDLVATATSEGGFGHTAKLYSDWQKLGARTKQLLFQDPALVTNLDQFFLVAKRIGENPNPSGTARIMTALNVSSIPVTYVLSQLMHTPNGVRLLTRGLTVPVGNKIARATWENQVANLIGREVEEAAVRMGTVRQAEPQAESGRPR